ncbi:nucleoside triphosphate pyrophosphohydrolase [Bacillus wiedmannii]|uniref:nucleoside triphosphate pyrophosphohydrolase n=1 Tax=Bacillus wiedmannii TaxID=1890302 RepID=UPI000BF4AF6A|nr:nucleoside triphosphate pyrophosphohydrolase [Bacillus wiedmannii]PFY77131.1 phosphoribosyl-ATP pyrophosphohydrolase [Bacillus wiedmannii]
MPTYNKLIRDKIPQIIKANGKTPTTRILPEEADTKEHKLEELSDLLELINALAEHEGTTLEEIDKIRRKKAEERGGFQNRIYLTEVR